MAGSTRIKGAALKLTLGGIDYWADVTNVRIENEEADGDVTTFADVAAGGARQYFLRGTAVQSTQAGSFWRMNWANAGNTVAYAYAVHGNASPSADQPHLAGSAKIGPKPALGGDADSTFTFDFEYEIDGVPVMDEGASAISAISTILPAGRGVGGNVIITGSRFTGTTDVKFAAVSATSVYVISDTQLSVVIPSGTGVKAVTVITPAGTSPAVNYTVV